MSRKLFLPDDADKPEMVLRKMAMRQQSLLSSFMDIDKLYLAYALYVDESWVQQARASLLCAANGHFCLWQLVLRYSIWVTFPLSHVQSWSDDKSRHLPLAISCRYGQGRTVDILSPETLNIEQSNAKYGEENKHDWKPGVDSFRQ